MDLSQNYWGGRVSNPTVSGQGAKDDKAEQQAPKITEEDRIRARVAVSRGEAELYLLRLPSAGFSMLELDLAGDIYKLVYEGEIYGYTNNPKIFKANN